ncbi:MAG TPA: SURF1 family protein, partial [Cellulomonas sp.]
RDAQIRLVEANYDADPVPLADLLPATDAVLDPGDVWQQVSASGHYDADATVLLRNRPVDSQPGFHVLVPLVLDGTTAADGGPVVLVVDRGWVAWDDDASGEVDVPAPPTGDVTVTARVRLDEPASTRSAPAGQVQAIHVDQVLAAGGVEATSFGAYGALVSESPAASTALGALPRPSTDPGSHLSYAFQWWVFALGSLVGFTWMARREVQDGRALAAAAAGTDDPTAPGTGTPAAPVAAPTTRSRRRPSDEETEDSLIDAQLH